MNTLCRLPRALLTLAVLTIDFAASAAVTVSVSPASIPVSYSGVITLQISGLTSGATVLVQHYLDLNTNGVADTGEPMVQSFRVTDGQVTTIGGARDGDVPGDNDLAANGQITTTLNFANGAEFARVSASHIFRVSSPSSSFSPVQKTLTVTKATYPQSITGTVSAGGSPLPFAMVGLLIPVGNNVVFSEGTVADASGKFSLPVSNGTYVVAGFKSGYIGNFSTGPEVTVSSANTNVTVALASSVLSVSGSLTDASSSAPLPGVQLFATSTNNEYAACFSDAQGSFAVNLRTGQWKLEASDHSLSLAGYFRASNKPKVQVGTSNITGLSLTYFKGTAMIYGTLKDSQNTPLPGVQLNCSDNGGLYQSNPTTDTNGDFFAMAISGTWNLGAGNGGSGLPPMDTLQNVQIALVLGQAVKTNLVAQSASSWLAGRAVDSNSNPINSGSILAFSSNNQFVSAQLAGDGSFALPVSGGSWSISLENGTAASHNVVAESLAVNVVNGVSVSNLLYVAPISTRTISGSVKTANGTNITGINVFGGAFINGTNYIAGASTDANGHYSLPVLPGSWSVSLDSQALGQLGYATPPNQYPDTTSASQTINFIVGPPITGTFIFRHNLGVVGEFGNSTTPKVAYPVTIKNYRAIFSVTDTNPPSPNLVLFTGPPGSGLTNAPADPSLSPVQNGSRVYFFSPAVRSPSVAMGGNWTVTYNGSIDNLTVPDPQAASRITVPLPTVDIQNGLLRSVQWAYRDQFGNLLGGAPAYVLTNRVDLFDQNGSPLDAELFPATTSYTYPSTNLFAWADISTLRVDYYDNLGNQFFVSFTESSPTLLGPSFVPGQGSQFILSGAAGQNFTIQYSTNLASPSWTTLYVTNSLTSPIAIADRNPAGPVRFYRVLVGP